MFWKVKLIHVKWHKLSSSALFWLTITAEEASNICRQSIHGIIGAVLEQTSSKPGNNAKSLSESFRHI